uniref:Uncharacterized protein n=1 Tax=Setaria italica TaxID=4555 RepID=K3XXH9_SETIT
MVCQQDKIQHASWGPQEPLCKTGAIDQLFPSRSAVDGVRVTFVAVGVQIATHHQQLGGIRRRALEVEQLPPEHVVEAVEEPLLDGVHGPFEAVEQLGGVLVVHEEAIVEVEAVTAGVVDEPEQRLVALGVDGRGAELEHGEHPADGVGEELGLGGVRVVLGAGHFDHPASLALEDVEEGLGAGAAGGAIADADLVEDEGEAVPAVARGLRAEHGVEHVDEEGVAAEAVDGERAEDGLGGEDGGGEEHHVRVALAEIVRVGEEARAEGRGDGGVVGAGVGQDGVALRHQRARQELAVVAEPNHGDLEARLLLLLILPFLELNRAGRRLAAVKRLRGARGAEAEGRSRRAAGMPAPAASRREELMVGGGGQSEGGGWLVVEADGGRRRH